MEKQTSETIKLAESMEKAGGIDAETLEVGLARLSKYLSPDQIKKMSKGWQDWMVTMARGAPTQQQAGELTDKINAYIQSGSPKLLKSLNLTKEQIKALGDQSSVAKRAAAVTRILGKETGATAAWKKTDAGLTYDLKQAQEAWLETAGEPMAEQARNMSVALSDLVKSLMPVAEVINAQVTPRLQELAKWIGENKEEIAAFAKGAVDWAFWLGDMTVKSFQDTTRQATDLWNNLIKSIQDTQAQFQAVVAWIDDHFIKPIYDLFA